jgi:hypothetical protein
LDAPRITDELRVRTLAGSDGLLVPTGRKPRPSVKLRTSAGAIFAAGDITGGLQLTHYAGSQGYAAAATLSSQAR